MSSLERRERASEVRMTSAFGRYAYGRDLAFQLTLAACVGACTGTTGPSSDPAVRTPGAAQGVAVVSGRVLDTLGRPLDSVAVLIRAAAAANLTGASVVTDGDGRFQATVLRIAPSASGTAEPVPAFAVAFTLAPKYPIRGGQPAARDSVPVNLTFSPAGTPPAVTTAFVRLALP